MLSRCPSPRAVGEAIAAAVPANAVLASATVAPAGFINAKVRDGLVSDFARSVAATGKAAPPPLSAFGGKRSVLVDFSSPNIAVNAALNGSGSAFGSTSKASSRADHRLG